MNLKTVKVPASLEELFLRAQDQVGQYFQNKHFAPESGSIEISGERYILIRAASMSVDFFETISALYQDEGNDKANNIARQFLFDISHAIGREDARNFHAKLELTDPVSKLSVGPVHFAYSGWAFVEIFPESIPTANENFYLLYDHPYSFESSSWLEKKKHANFPVCVMNAGYSSGWCEESFGIALAATEVLCQARGDAVCRFIMAPPNAIEGHVSAYIHRHPQLPEYINDYEIPGFFKRKQLEQQLLESEAHYRSVFSNAQDLIFTVNAEEQLTSVNPAFLEQTGCSEHQILHQPFAKILPADHVGEFSDILNRILNGRVGLRMETAIIAFSGKLIDVDVVFAALINSGEKQVICFARDISARKIQETEQKKYQVSLERQVARRTIALQRANVALKKELQKRKMSEEKFHFLATTDMLTGIFNRYEFYRLLEQEISKAHRYRFPLSLIMYDFDYFKKINDKWGHDAGDKVLKAATRIVKENIRESDILGRWGGEEFMIIISNANVFYTSKLAEKLRAEIDRSLSIKNIDVTASFGVVSLTAEDDLNSLVKKADSALYDAKHKGRNRVSFF